MNYERLVAFGCSHTYGHGLSDCIQDNNEPKSKPSELSWPSVLAETLGLKKINMSNPGASNKRIWYDIINFPFNKKDLAVVMWTNNNRWCSISEKDIDDIGLWSKDKKSKIFFKFFYSHFDLNLDLNLRVSHVNYYLNELGVKHFQVFYRKKDFEEMPFCKNTYTLPISFEHYKKKYPLTNDKIHLGEEAHYNFAQEIHYYIEGQL